MVELHNRWIYKLPDGKYVEATELSPGRWVLWPIIARREQNKAILTGEKPEYDISAGEEVAILNSDLNYDISPDGVVLYGLEEVCTLDDLQDTGLIHESESWRVWQR